MDYAIAQNLKCRKIDRPSAEDKDTAAAIVLEVAFIMGCTVDDLEQAFKKSEVAHRDAL